ncbi:MAG TPA: DNA translocase FtsK 4TM domain-containing protein, partial [Xanthobacteraceae bacterium]
MLAIWRGFDLSFIPDELRAAGRRRLRDAAGLALVSAAAALALSLATWSASDPSFTNATKAPVRNLLGPAGAAASDLLMQMFGLASLALLAPLAIWGWRLLSRRPLGREKLRAVAWVLGLAAAAGFAACVPATATWPLPTGLGGALGDAVLRIPAVFLGWPLGLGDKATVAVVMGALACAALLTAAGAVLRARTDDSDSEAVAAETGSERGAWLLGFCTHAMLSAQSRAMRLIAHVRAGLASRHDHDVRELADGAERV